MFDFNILTSTPITEEFLTEHGYTNLGPHDDNEQEIFWMGRGLNLIYRKDYGDWITEDVKGGTNVFSIEHLQLLHISCVGKALVPFSIEKLFHKYTEKELLNEIHMAYIHGQGNGIKMEAGLERDEIEDYINSRMLNIKNGLTKEKA